MKITDSSYRKVDYIFKKMKKKEEKIILKVNGKRMKLKIMILIGDND